MKENPPKLTSDQLEWIEFNIYFSLYKNELLEEFFSEVGRRKKETLA